MKTFSGRKKKRERNHVCNIKVIINGITRVKEETAIVVMVNVFMAMWSMWGGAQHHRDNC